MAGGRVFAREGSGGGNVVLSAATGALLGTFNAVPSPAIAGNVMYTLDGTTLRSVNDSGLGTNGWQFTGDGGLTTAPLRVGALVFAGSSTGALHALDAATGTSNWSTNVGSAIPAPDEHNVSQPLTGLGAANGTLVVPAGARLVAYRTAGAITLAPANTAAPTIDGRPQVGQRLAADVGIWSRLPSCVQLRVAALRRHGRELRRRPGRHRSHVHTGVRRCRRDAARAGHGNERHRGVGPGARRARPRSSASRARSTWSRRRSAEPRRWARR